MKKAFKLILLITVVLSLMASILSLHVFGVSMYELHDSTSIIQNSTIAETEDTVADMTESNVPLHETNLADASADPLNPGQSSTQSDNTIFPESDNLDGISSRSETKPDDWFSGSTSSEKNNEMTTEPASAEPSNETSDRFNQQEKTVWVEINGEEGRKLVLVTVDSSSGATVEKEIPLVVVILAFVIAFVLLWLVFVLLFLLLKNKRYVGKYR